MRRTKKNPECVSKISVSVAWLFALSILAGPLHAADVDVHEEVHVEQLTAKTGSSWNGSARPEHMHAEINAGVLLRGELTVVSEKGETLRMVEGDTIVERVNQWHHGVNAGEEPAEILVFYAGVENSPITVVRSSTD